MDEKYASTLHTWLITVKTNVFTMKQFCCTKRDTYIYRINTHTHTHSAAVAWNKLKLYVRSFSFSRYNLNHFTNFNSYYDRRILITGCKMTSWSFSIVKWFPENANENRLFYIVVLFSEDALALLPLLQDDNETKEVINRLPLIRSMVIRVLCTNYL